MFVILTATYFEVLENIIVFFFFFDRKECLPTDWLYLIYHPEIINHHERYRKVMTSKCYDIEINKIEAYLGQ